MCGSDGTGLPSWTTVTPFVEPARPTAAARDELRRRRRVDHDLAAGQPGRVPCTVNGEPAVAVDARAERPQRVEHRAHRALPGVRVAVEARPARRRARRPAARTASRCRPARSRRAPPPRQAVVRAGRRTCVAVDVDRERRGRAARRPSASVSRRAQRAAMTVAGPPASAASTSARLVSDLEPGTATRPRTGPVAAGAGQGVLAPPSSQVMRPGAQPRPRELSAGRATMDACAVATPRRRRPRIWPTSSGPSTRRTGRRSPTSTSRPPSRSSRSSSGTRATTRARRTRSASSGRCGCCAGDWCRRGRRTRRAAPG